MDSAQSRTKNGKRNKFKSGSEDKLNTRKTQTARFMQNEELRESLYKAKKVKKFVIKHGALSSKGLEMQHPFRRSKVQGSNLKKSHHFSIGNGKRTSSTSRKVKEM